MSGCYLSPKTTGLCDRCTSACLNYVPQPPGLASSFLSHMHPANLCREFMICDVTQLPRCVEYSRRKLFLPHKSFANTAHASLTQSHLLVSRADVVHAACKRLCVWRGWALATSATRALTTTGTSPTWLKYECCQVRRRGEGLQSSFLPAEAYSFTFYTDQMFLISASKSYL